MNSTTKAIIIGLLTALFVYIGYTIGYNNGLDEGIIKGENNIKSYMEFNLDNVGLTYLDINFNRVYLKPVTLDNTELAVLKIKEARL